EAVRQEYRCSVTWKRLRCRNVEQLTGHSNELIFVLDVGHAIEFDWTWEGAVAFRPPEPGKFTGDIDVTDAFAGLVPDNGSTQGQPGTWSGEVVEVDETNGRLFVAVSGLNNVPCRGTFFVRPFEFLAFLRSLFCQPSAGDFKRLLSARLNATR